MRDGQPPDMNTLEINSVVRWFEGTYEKLPTIIVRWALSV